MKISEMIRQALDKKGFRNLKDASKALSISPELLRVTLNKGHIPKDRTLGVIANRLGLDKAMLILAAHQEKVPTDVKGFFLPPAQSKSWREKRVFPLSEEQCNYLERMMSPQEIQMVRKYRQISQEGKTQIAGYVDYMFATKRKA